MLFFNQEWISVEDIEGVQKIIMGEGIRKSIAKGSSEELPFVVLYHSLYFVPKMRSPASPRPGRIYLRSFIPSSIEAR